jgi:hypothetical protein
MPLLTLILKPALILLLLLTLLLLRTLLQLLILVLLRSAGMLSRSVPFAMLAISTCALL